MMHGNWYWMGWGIWIIPAIVIIVLLWRLSNNNQVTHHHHYHSGVDGERKLRWIF